MNMQFKKAEKSTSLLRCAIFGPPGAGKTYSALRMAKGMGGKVAFIDTERGSASKYADRFEFDVLELPNADIDTYVQAMDIAAKNQYSILIIDSLSHAWQELLQEGDTIAKAKYRGNTWGAWSEGTPKQKKMVNAILTYPGHIISTMRSKVEYSLEQTSGNKNRPVKVGMAPEQGKGIEYEFDLLLEINQDHFCTVSKDRTGKFQDKVYEKPNEEFGKTLIDWLSTGKKVHANQSFIDSVIALGVDPKTITDTIKQHHHKSLETILDRPTQKVVYKTLLAIKENFPASPPPAAVPVNNPPVAPVQANAFVPSNTPVGPTPVMDQNTKNFLTAMGNFKKDIAQLTGNERLYYQTLGTNGFTHANEVGDAQNMNIVYQAMEAVVKDLRPKTGASNA